MVAWETMSFRQVTVDIMQTPALFSSLAPQTRRGYTVHYRGGQLKKKSALHVYIASACVWIFKI